MYSIVKEKEEKLKRQPMDCLKLKSMLYYSASSNVFADFERISSVTSIFLGNTASGSVASSAPKICHIYRRATSDFCKNWQRKNV